MRDYRSFAARLSGAELTVLYACGRPVSYQRGDQLMRQGERGECVIVVRSGLVKVTRTDDTGSIRLLGVRGPGELLGEMSCLDEQPRSASVVAHNEVYGVRIAGKEFLDYLYQHPRAAREVTCQMASRLRAAERHQEAMAAGGVDGRVLWILSDMSELFAPNGARTAEIPLHQHELAQLIATALISVQRSLRVLRTNRLVTTRRGRIVVPCVRCLRRAAVVRETGTEAINRRCADPDCCSG
ncbi:CRP-like cAMP-binding protein [Herbihabitans rhizosphaerae]|uniref:CRP-like cAMP-binding protein n=1 Tax=Herbihabitans rhizosphaerae TaxID=1872711 RepID=A0A4Q7L8R7_9PSEU|nr:Crp/Fnr family transcriptional regulator [Herbihabitans rhizosphaerae]RZS44802.1 CRP-like cAMP-binding protein [Herbihabitans rhizosphaerae]